VTDVDEATPLVVMVNVALLEPAGIATFAGSWAADVLLLCKVTETPPVGAAPVSVTVPVELLPPTTDAGVLVSPENVGAFTVSVVVRATPYVPVIVTEEFTATGVVVMVNVADLAPGAIVTLAGTCPADVLLLLNVTTAPTVGAAPLRVTVPVELLPPTTEIGDRLTEDKDAAVTVSVALVLVPRVAVTTEVVVEATPNVVTVKVPDVLPADTVTLAGTLAATVLLLVRLTETPPVGAAAFSCTVPVELFPPTTLVGFSDTEDTPIAGLTVIVAFALPPKVAVMLTVVVVATELVVTANVVDVLPAGTVTLAGTAATNVLLLERFTATPPAGEAPLRVTVPVEGLPPVTMVGFRETEDRVTAGFTVKAAVRVVPTG